LSKKLLAAFHASYLMRPRHPDRVLRALRSIWRNLELVDVIPVAFPPCNDEFASLVGPADIKISDASCPWLHCMHPRLRAFSKIACFRKGSIPGASRIAKALGHQFSVGTAGSTCATGGAGVAALIAAAHSVGCCEHQLRGAKSKLRTRIQDHPFHRLALQISIKSRFRDQ